MTDFTPEFANAPGGYEDVAGPLLLGLDPLLAALLLALVGLAAFVGFKLGESRRSPDGDEEAVAKAIHKRVLKAAKEALSAESDRMVEKARALRNLVEADLGHVKTLGGGLAGPIGRIDKALEGKREPAKPAPAPAGPSPAASTAQNPTINVTVNTVLPPAPPAPPAGDLSGREQIDELARAVRAFHDWWSRRDDRVGDLIGARRQLSRMPKDADHDDDHGAHDDHGEGHDDDHGDGHDHGHAEERRPLWDRKKKH